MTESQNKDNFPDISSKDDVEKTLKELESKVKSLDNENPDANLDDITLKPMHENDSQKQLKSVSMSGRIHYQKNGKSNKSSHKVKRHHRHSQTSRTHLRAKSNTKHRHHKHSKKMRLPIKILLIVLAVIALLAIILSTAFSISSQLGKRSLLEKTQTAIIGTIDGATSSNDGATVYYDGKIYTYNPNVLSVVFMGIDRSELDADLVGNGGQADAIYIFTYDLESGRCCAIPVSRDTMVEVRTYSASGAAMSLETMQLCLSYGYGNGQDTSCQNTLESLSRLFYNLPFSSYVAMNWDGIAPLNDAIGGVTITALEDVDTQYSSIKKGDKLTLKGKDAWSYVKYRNTSILESNNLRIDRQKQYLKAYTSNLMPAIRQKFTIVTDLINTALEYTYSNLTVNQVVYIASRIVPDVYSSNDIEFKNIKGKVEKGDLYAEFYPNEKSLYKTILDVFYTEETDQ